MNSLLWKTILILLYPVAVKISPFYASPANFARQLEHAGAKGVVIFNRFFEADIDKLATAGVTRGCNPPVNDRFCPDSSVTREEMASLLGRALGLESLPVG